MIDFMHVVDLSILVGEPIEIGQTPMGVRRVIPILGGEALGPLLRGKILPAGADFQIIRRDGVTELHARYVLETSDGTRIYIENYGLRHGSSEAMERLRRGEPVDPALIYFRTAPRFETAGESTQWLTKNIFVGGTSSGSGRTRRVSDQVVKASKDMKWPQ